MQMRILTSCLSTATASAVCLILATGQQANAVTLRAMTEGTVVNTFTECINDGIALAVGTNPTDQYGWQYAIDSFSDGVQGFQVGGNVYEIHSLAIRETVDSILVALNANMPLTGATASGAVDGNIGWGDLFLNFSGLDFTTASNQGNLFAVRFAGTNDSSVPNVGLYGNVTATSVTNVNSGFSSLRAYNQRVATYGCQGAGCGPSLGDLAADTSYFDQNQSFNAIATGEFLTGIIYLSNSELSAAGYDINRFSGEHTIAFKFDKSAICDRIKCKKVPEPSSIAGIAVIGLAFAASQLSKRRRNGVIAK